ncbi:MAG: sugar phosphate isomerase/epimerase family protein [Patescibacteria group bacterium]
MNLSVSNIAWNREENDKALELLKKYGIFNIEIAPTLLFPNFLDTTDDEVKKLRDEYNSNGFSFVSMQSLLYGAPEHTIFDGAKRVKYLFDYLTKDMKVANLLGIKNLVFGSPKNRFSKNPINKESINKATSFFQKLIEEAQKNDVTVSLEANPREYGCNFITNTIEAIEFVKKINDRQFRLNLDIGAILMNNENLENVILKAHGIIGHVHISTPFLSEIDNSTIDHSYTSKIIKDCGYNGSISLEMKANKTSSNLAILERNIKVFVKHYV